MHQRRNMSLEEARRNKIINQSIKASPTPSTMVKGETNILPNVTTALNVKNIQSLPLNKNVYVALDNSDGIEKLLKETDSPIRFIDDTPTPSESLYDTICNLPRVLDLADLQRMDQGTQLRNNRPQTVKSVKRRSRSMSRNRLSREQNNDINNTEEEIDNIYATNTGQDITDRATKSLENIFKASNKKHVSFLEDDLVTIQDERSEYGYTPTTQPIPISSVQPVPILSPSSNRAGKPRPLPPPRIDSTIGYNDIGIIPENPVTKPMVKYNYGPFDYNGNNSPSTKRTIWDTNSQAQPMTSTTYPPQGNLLNTPNSQSINTTTSYSGLSNQLASTTSCAGYSGQIPNSARYSGLREDFFSTPTSHSLLPRYELDSGVIQGQLAKSCSYSNVPGGLLIPSSLTKSQPSSQYQVSPAVAESSNSASSIYLPYNNLYSQSALSHLPGGSAGSLSNSVPPAVILSRNHCTCDNRGSSDSGLADISVHTDLCPLSIQSSVSRLHAFTTPLSPVVERRQVEASTGFSQPRRVQSQMMQPVSMSSGYPQQDRIINYGSVPELRTSQQSGGVGPYSQGVLSPDLIRKHPLRYPGQQDLFHQSGSMEITPRSSLRTAAENDYQVVSMGNLGKLSSPTNFQQSRILSQFQTFRPSEPASRETSFHSQFSYGSGKDSNNVSSICSSFEYSGGLLQPVSPTQSPNLSSRPTSQNSTSAEKIYYTEQTFVQHDQNMNQIKPVIQQQQQQPQYKTGLYAHWLMNASLQPIKEECQDQHSLPSI